MTLNRYTYANDDSVNAIDPSGKFSVTEQTEVALVGSIEADIGTASFATLSQPLMARAILYAAIAIAGVYVILDKTTKTTIEECMKSSFSGQNKCNPDFPIFILGDDYNEVRDHVGDAIRDGKPSMLTKREPAYSRNWLTSQKGTGKPCSNASGTQCDEYPFASTIEGGGGNDVSLRSVNSGQNLGAGAQLKWFYTKCNIRANNAVSKFKVMAMQGISKSGYICGR